MKCEVPVACELGEDMPASDGEDWLLVYGVAGGGEFNVKTLRGEVAVKNDGLRC